MYSFEQLMIPVWDTAIVYDESLTMTESNGVVKAPLLFEPKEILSVTSADKMQVYEKDRDWYLKDGMFCLTNESRIFRFSEKEIIFDTPIRDGCFETIDGRYSLFSEGHFFHDRQISVTYIKGSQDFAFRPKYCGNHLPKTMKKLQNKERLDMLLYGDSILVGANCSGMTLTTPFLPNWGALFAEQLRRHYGARVEVTNTAIGGTNSFWGIEHAKQNAGDHKPDLALIGFGMNDNVSKEVYSENMKKLLDIIWEASPDTEFILCSTVMPNKNLKNVYTYQEEYRDVLEKMSGEGVVFADFFSMQKELLKRKRYIDLAGNNVNHPNDFFIRCYAHLLADMLIKKQ